MYGGRSDCCILAMLMDVTVFITLFAFNYSTKHAAIEKRKCNIQNLYNAFTTADIQNIQQKDDILRSVFTNTTKFPSKLTLENYLQVLKNKRESSVNRRYQLLLQNCSNQTNICIKYIIKLHADDYILDPSNYYIYYKRRKRIYRSTISYAHQSEFLFKINAQKTRFVYLNNKLNLLFCEQTGSEATYNVFHYRLRARNCILQIKLSMPYARLKRSVFQSGSGGTLIIIIALVIGVPILIILTSVFIIVVMYYCCQKNGTTEDELPKSLIENCRRAEPPPEEQGKYLPELFDASAFQFKGPLIIECPKLHILEHDLTNAKPSGSNIKDHVRFDENLNVAYNIGENVEIIVRSYGQGTKIGSGEMIKEDGGDEDDETTNEQENDSRQSVIENGEKEVAKHSKSQSIQSQEKKNGIRKVSDPRRKSKPVSIRTQKTQPSRYSESSTQTFRVDGETNVKSPKKCGGMDVTNTRERNFNIGYEADIRQSKSLLKRASATPVEQTTQAPSKNIMLTKEQHVASSIDATNITTTLRTAKSQQWTAEQTNPSVSGSSRSQCKSCNTSERMRSEVGRKFTYLW